MATASKSLTNEHIFGVGTYKSFIFALVVSRQNCYAHSTQNLSAQNTANTDNRCSRDLTVYVCIMFAYRLFCMCILFICIFVLLQHMYAFWGGRLIEASHVVMHLWKTLLHVILSTALSHRPKTEAQGRVVELRRGQIRHGWMWWERQEGVSRWSSYHIPSSPQFPTGFMDMESDNPSEIIPHFAH